MQATIEDPRQNRRPRPPGAWTQRDALEDSLSSLNERQREAASCGNQPLLIIAGAGTGKTTTLAHRVAYQIATGVDPGRILLLTFTRRAAGEMLRRVDSLLRVRHSVGVPVEPSREQATARCGEAPSTPSRPGCCGSTAVPSAWTRDSPSSTERMPKIS